MLLPLVTVEWQNRYRMDSQVYIKFVVVDPFFIYTKFEYFDHFIDKKRDGHGNAKFKQNTGAP